MRHYKA